MEEQQKIVLYQSEDGSAVMDVHLENETVWLNQQQMALLFGRDPKTISKHINNTYNEGELERDPTVAYFETVQREGKRDVKRNIEYYNLDVIISVGYRVKSKQGTQFRIWANSVIKDHLVKGYSLNEKLLQKEQNKFKALQDATSLVIQTVDGLNLSSNETTGILKVLKQYASALLILDQYDHQSLEIYGNLNEDIWKLSYDNAIEQIEIWRNEQKAGKLFGNEKDDSFKSSLETIYQTFDGSELYPSTEEKAANLLYFIVKNHSFTDGNKRIGAGLFVYFLDQNKRLYKKSGAKVIEDNALVAITLMIAESKSEEKETVIKLVVNLMDPNL